MEEGYRRQKIHPNPFMEFCLSWIHRHPPQSHGREAPVVWDSGQFHHHDGRLVAILDVELGHLGDPMMDLAGWRMRDSVLGFGDFTTIYERYEEITGRPVDLEAIQLHHIAFTFSNALSFSHALMDPPPRSDFTTNLQWCNETNLYATEAIAEYLDVELPTVEPIEARNSRFAPASGHLVQILRSMETDDVLLKYQARMAFRLSRHLLRVDEIGNAVIEADLDDLGRGSRPPPRHVAGRREGPRALRARRRRGRCPRRGAAPPFPPAESASPDAQRSCGLGDGSAHPFAAVSEVGLTRRRSSGAFRVETPDLMAREENFNGSNRCESLGLVQGFRLLAGSRGERG